VSAAQPDRAGLVGSPAARPASYGRLLRSPGFAPLLSSALLSRTAVQLWAIATVLFALQRYHSASVAGLSIFLLIFPGLVLSPVNGALLDRFGRTRLMMLDLSVAAACVGTIAALAAAGRLPVWLLLLILAAGSLTSTLSVAGARSLFPLLVDRELWDRANAADSLCYAVAQIAGPALAGLLTARFGSEWALTAAGIAFVVAATSLRGIREPYVRDRQERLLWSEALHGVRYVLSNRTLRWLAVSLSVGNAGWGMVLVALPLLVFRLHGNAAVVGGLFALQGVVGIPATLLAGRMNTNTRERGIIALCSVVVALATLALLIPALTVVAIALACAGIAEGPMNVSLFSLRQRRTPPAWFGRAFAISMSLNFAGMPLGSALSGPILGVSITLAIVVAAALAAFQGIIALTLVPSRA